MNSSFERTAKATDEWYTPKEIIDALGHFDLDPCSAEHPLWPTAQTMWNKNDDGLSREWFGRVWLNPPYSRPLVEEFLRMMSEHGNGIALMFNRCDSKMFQKYVFDAADGIMFLKHRIKFYRPDGTRGDSPGCGSVLIAYGEENMVALRRCGLEGRICLMDKR